MRADDNGTCEHRLPRPRTLIDGATTWHGENRVVRIADPTELSLFTSYVTITLEDDENRSVNDSPRNS